MKKILLILLFASSLFAAEGDTLITVFDLPRVTTNNDSSLFWFVDAVNGDTLSRAMTLDTLRIILGDSLKIDSLFSEASFTQAFNARLDSIGILNNAVWGVTTKKEIDSTGVYDWLKSGGGEYFYRPRTIGALNIKLAQVYHTGANHYLNIACIGNSLTAYSIHLRKMLANKFGSGGLGFVSVADNKYTSPALVTVTQYGAWTSNDLVDNDVDFGIDGTSLASTTPAADSIKMETIETWRYCRVWYAAGEGTSFDVIVNGVNKGTFNTAGTGLGKTTVIDAGSLDSLAIVIKNIVGNVVLYGVDYKGSRFSSGSIVHDLGNGGSAAAEWQNHMSYVRAFVDSLNADMIMVELSVADAGASVDSATYRGYITEIVDSLQYDNEVPLIVIAPNNVQDSATNLLMEQYKIIHKDLIRTRGIGFYDVKNMWPSYDYANNIGVMKDAIHPNSYGYEAIASAIIRNVFVGFDKTPGLYGNNIYYGVTTKYGLESLQGGVEISNPGSDVLPLHVFSGATDWFWIDTNGHVHIYSGKRMYFDERAYDFQFVVKDYMLQFYNGLSSYTFQLDHYSNAGFGGVDIKNVVNDANGTIYMHDNNNNPGSVPSTNDIGLFVNQDAEGVRQLWTIEGDGSFSQLSGLLGAVIDSVAVSADSLFLYDLDSSKHVSIKWHNN